MDRCSDPSFDLQATRNLTTSHSIERSLLFSAITRPSVSFNRFDLIKIYCSIINGALQSFSYTIAAVDRDSGFPIEQAIKQFLGNELQLIN